MNNLIKKVIKKKITKSSVHNIRENGELVSRNYSDKIIIESKKDKQGIDVFVQPDTKGENVFVPVIISYSNIVETVYNDFFIGENSEVTIYAGCAIHNEGSLKSTHNGVHSFYLEKNTKVTYIEEHYAEGLYERKDINTITNVSLKEKSTMIFNTTQLRGVDNSKRNTKAILDKDSCLQIEEKLITEGKEKVHSSFEVKLLGTNSKVEINSKAFAKDNSTQEFISNVIGKEKCFGHISCDAILMDKASAKSSPKINAKSSEAILSHEAVIGKLSTEQVTKLMTLGLTQKEAENKIINGFLKD